jgi:hypothetical protein
MNSRLVYDLIVDVETFTVKNSDGTALDGSLTFWRGTQVLMKVTFQKTDLTAFDLPTGTVFYFGIDNEYTAGKADIVSSLHSQFNIAGDWTFDLATGKVCWRVNMNTSELRTAIGTGANLGAFAALWATPPGESPYLLFHIPIIVSNIAVEVGSPSANPLPSYASLDYVNNLFVPRIPTNAKWRFTDDGRFLLFNSVTGKYHEFFPNGIEGSVTGDWGAGET